MTKRVSKKKRPEKSPLAEKQPHEKAGKRFRDTFFWIFLGWLFFFPWLFPHTLTYPLMGSLFFLEFSLVVSIPFALYGLARSYLTVPPQKLWWFLLFFILAVILGTAFSILPLRSIWGAYQFLGDGLVYYFATATLVLLFSTLKIDEQKTRSFFTVLMAQLAVIGLLTLKEAFDHHALTTTYRVISPLLNSNNYLSYTLLLLPLASLFTWRLWRWLSDLSHNWYRFLAPFPLLLLVFTIFCATPTQLQQRLMPWRLPAGVTASSSSSEVPFLADASNTERFTEWRVGWKIGLDHPLTGSGPGTTRALFYQQAPTLSTWDFSVAMDLAHNDLIQQFSQLGLLGLATYLALWLFGWWRLIRNRRRIPPSLRPCLFAAGAGLGLYFLFNLVTFTIEFPGILLLLFLFLIGSFTEEPRNPSRPFRLARPLAMIVLLPAFLLGLWSFRYWYAESLITEARGQGTDYRTAETLANQAVASFPQEETYHQLAAGYAFNQIVTAIMQGAPYAPATVSRAQTNLRQALELNPYLTRTEFIQSALNYLVAEPNSTAETAAIRQLSGIITDRMPWDPSYYRFAESILALHPTSQLAQVTRASLVKNAPAKIQKQLQ